MRKLVFVMSGSLAVFLAHGNNGRTLHRYLWANYQAYNGNIKSAAQWYQTLKASDQSRYTYTGYIAFLYRTQRYAEVVDLAKKININTCKDPDTRLLCALALKKTGCLQQAMAQLSQLSQEFKQHFEITYNTAETFIECKELHNAISVMDNFLAATPKRSNHFIFYFLKAQLYAQLGKPHEAQENIDLCIKKQPSFNKGWLLFALIKEQFGKIESAIKGYTNYLELSPEQNGDIRRHLIELTTIQSERSRQKLATNELFGRCTTLLKKRQFKELLAFTTKHLAQTPASFGYRLFKIQALIGLSDHHIAVDQLVTWTLEKTDKDQWLSVLHLLLQTDTPPAIIVKGFEQLAAQQPHDIKILLYLADLYARTSHQKDKALATYRTALAMTNGSPLAARICYHMALMHYEQNNYQDMRTLLTQGLAHDATFSPTHNLLAYYHATKDKNLAQAATHIATALRYAPTNPHFLDTQATIWYKQKEYQQAADAWQKILITLPHDPTILMHYAKVQKKLGRDANARASLASATTYAHKAEQKEKCHKLALSWQEEQSL